MITHKAPMQLTRGDVIAVHPVDNIRGRWPVADEPVQCGEIAEIPYNTGTGTAWLTASIHADLTLVTTPRQDVIAGLRALADFLEANPHVPVSRDPEVLYFASRGRDVEAAVREVDRVAGLIGVPSGQRSTAHVAARVFHGVRYEAVAFHAYPKEAA